MRKIGLYAGSFDPFTLGHLAIVCKALGSYDEIIIGAGINEHKKYLFDDEQQRAELINKTFTDFIDSYNNRHLNGKLFEDFEIIAIQKIKANPNIVKTTSYNDLTIDCAIRNNATSLIRGERNSGDTVEETQLENMNKALAEVRGIDIKTDRIPVPKSGLEYVSSSACKSLCSFGEYIAAEKFVSPSVHNEMMKKKYYMEKPLYLYKEFQKLGNHFGVNESEVDIHFNKLVKHYSQDRHYHNLTHIAYTLNQINNYKKSGRDVPNIEALKIAVFFHDIINDGKEDDEAKSAKMATDFMHNADKKNKDIVYNCIMTTKHNNKNSQKMILEEEIIADADLAILGDYNNFGIFSQSVRKEYARFANKDYAKGRTAVLNKFSNSEKIYQTEYFSRFETKAKDNIKKETDYWLGVSRDLQTTRCNTNKSNKSK